MSLIKSCNCCFSYDGIPVVENVTFELNAGDYLAIVGENGAGKSTLMKGLLHLKKPYAGEILYNGTLRVNEIGYLPQQTLVQKDFPASVYEVVLSGCLNQIGCHFFYSSVLKKKAEENMKLLEIENLKSKCYRDLSGGQQQRVLLARAMCAAKKALLLDEPVTGLDPIVSAELYKTIRELHERHHMTIIMISHDIQGAVQEADKILHLDHEQKFFGTAESYRQSCLGRAFLKGGIA
jgi:zinc transport system ATP-binding protein